MSVYNNSFSGAFSSSFLVNLIRQKSGLHVIRASAAAVGIAVVFTNSEERIEAQLNRVTKNMDIPIMLISWDIDTTVNIDENGRVENPISSIVALLVSKPTDLTDNKSLYVAENMGTLFIKFIKNLNDRLKPLQMSTKTPITEIGYKLVPKHGAGKHSGVLARWKQSNYIFMEC